MMERPSPREEGAALLAVLILVAVLGALATFGGFTLAFPLPF